MPNTLAHLGVQALVTRGVMPGADLKWIYLGCVLPDAPWILQRAVRATFPDVPLYDLRLYVIAQSALFACLLLAGALSCLSVRPGRVFAMLALGSVLHLLMDALQTKWANGVHLFAPLTWEMLNFGLFWPEDLPSYALTALGLGYFVYAWWRLPYGADDLVRPRGRRLALGGALVAVYLVLPVALISGPEAADNHFVKTLREVEQRPGRALELDRRPYVKRDGGDVLVTMSREELDVEGPTPEASAEVSIRGRFVDRDTVRILELHVHSSWFRDLSSYLGLGFVLAYWARCLASLCR